MGNNSKNDEKHTWAALVAIALFSNSFVLFLQTIKESPPSIKKTSSSLNQKKLPPPFFFFLSHVYIYIYHLPNPKSVPERKIPYFLSSFLLILFLNLPIQKQSSQLQILLQYLPRRVPLSLNSNGEFPCKSMKF